MTSSEPVLSLDQVYFRYGNEIALENITMNIEKGEFLGLVGPNGSGKSTLIKVILGLLKPDEGEVKLFGKPLSRFNNWSKIGYVSQKANSFNTGFPATVFEVVSMGLYGKMGLFKWLGREEKTKIKEAIELVGLSEHLRQSIGKLSGGQQQRAFIARALVSDPELLILDEPTVGVDAQSMDQFFHLLEVMHKERNISLLLVSHDIGAITSKVDNVACLNRKMYFHGSPKEFKIDQERIVHQLYGHDVQLLDHNHE